MHHVTMYLDFVSPYAWLAFQQLPQALQGLNCRVEYRPALLGALLQMNNNTAPASIPGKRAWIYRHTQWLGQHLGVPLQMPATHPFNPLPLLRLSLQTSEDGSVNRYVAETIFRHVWESGAEALDSERLQALEQQLSQQLQASPQREDNAKKWLRSNTDRAAAAGLFGLPAFEAGEQIFWGLDSLPMLRDFLQGNPWFQKQGGENANPVSAGLA